MCYGELDGNVRAKWPDTWDVNAMLMVTSNDSTRKHTLGRQIVKSLWNALVNNIYTWFKEDKIKPMQKGYKASFSSAIIKERTS